MSIYPRPTIRWVLSGPFIAFLCAFTGCLDIDVGEAVDPLDSGVGADMGVPGMAPEAFDWATPIAANHLNHEPHPLLKGVRMHEIINSWRSAREDGLLCSDCHHEDGYFPYRPEIDANRPSSIGPNDIVDGHAWSEVGGWAERFILQDESTPSPKPPYLRELFRRWLESREEP